MGASSKVSNELFPFACYILLDIYFSAPFTIQRLCELLTDPKKHYRRTDKFLRGVEKVSTCTFLQHYWMLQGTYIFCNVLSYNNQLFCNMMDFSHTPVCQHQSLLLTYFIFQIQLMNISAMI